MKRIPLKQKLRSVVIKKYKNKCADCAEEKNLIVHHLDENPNHNIIRNLILLCPFCHAKRHYPKMEKFNVGEIGYMIRGSMYIPVIIKDIKIGFGRTRYLISPLHGSGEMATIKIVKSIL